eukprot:TRINITY_DN3427_c0_g4_i1.p3 TRINITY_DN3427_c0_g4~~TRINITY_DN3427_c0_g4_i1.p3  ORF type:complete len:122 (+),score=46.06 TRINITY_DN3427_c0_g4_i1:541-906(+)
MAVHMEKTTRKTAEKMKLIAQQKRKTPEESQAEDKEIPIEGRISFDEKVKFTRKVRKLSQEGIVQFMELVRKNCADAIKEITPRKLQIKMNDIDKEAFVKLKEFLDEQVTEKAPKKTEKVE